MRRARMRSQHSRTTHPVAQIATPANRVSLRKWAPCTTRPALAMAPAARPISSQRRRVATGPISPTAMITKPEAACPLVNEQLWKHSRAGSSASEKWCCAVPTSSATSRGRARPQNSLSTRLTSSHEPSALTSASEAARRRQRKGTRSGQRRPSTMTTSEAMK